MFSRNLRKSLICIILYRRNIFALTEAQVFVYYLLTTIHSVTNMLSGCWDTSIIPYDTWFSRKETTSTPCECMTRKNAVNACWQYPYIDWLIIKRTSNNKLCLLQTMDILCQQVLRLLENHRNNLNFLLLIHKGNILCTICLFVGNNYRNI